MPWNLWSRECAVPKNAATNQRINEPSAPAPLPVAKAGAVQAPAPAPPPPPQQQVAAEPAVAGPVVAQANIVNTANIVGHAVDANTGSLEVFAGPSSLMAPDGHLVPRPATTVRQMVKNCAVTYRQTSELPGPIHWTTAGTAVPNNEERLLVKLPPIAKRPPNGTGNVPNLYLCLLTPKEAWGCQQLAAAKAAGQNIEVAEEPTVLGMPNMQLLHDKKSWLLQQFRHTSLLLALTPP